MSDEIPAKQAVLNLETVRKNKPLIHNITNYVVMNFTANALLACGASPVMAHAPEEVEEMVSLAGALVLNIGTLTTDWVNAMLIAGKRANECNVPIILDPVGAGATQLRTESARRLIDALSIRVIRGNASEVLSLSQEGARTKGVDSIHRVEDAENAARTLARDLNATLAITGPTDLITDGEAVIRVSNGHELMGYVTGTGCTATALIGAFLSVDSIPISAASTALAYFGLAGEKGAAASNGPGSFQIALLDALFQMDAATLENGVRIAG